MSVVYVSKSGSNSNQGTESSPWLTISYAVSKLALIGGTILVDTGRYTEIVYMESNIVLKKKPGAGEVVIDGTGNISAIEIRGKSWCTVDGFIIENDGGVPVGWSVTSGIHLRDRRNIPGPGQGTHDVVITNCIFRNIKRHSDNPGIGALALGITSFADERRGHEGCYNIQVTNCTFYEGKYNVVGSGLGISSFDITGNVRDFLIDNCIFNHDMATYGEQHGAIEFVANYETYYSTYPDIPRKGVIQNCTFNHTGTLTGGNYCVYAQVQDVLIRDCTTNNWPLGIGVVTESGGNYNPARNVWVHSNTLNGCSNYSLLVGAWANIYTPVENVWFTSNYILKPNIGVNEFPPITVVNRSNQSQFGWGLLKNSRFQGNVISTPDTVINLEQDTTWLFRDNKYYTNSATPLRYPNYATKIAIPWNSDQILPYNANPDEIDTLYIPDWYYNGLFGKYDPNLRPVAPYRFTYRKRKKWYE